MAILLYDFRKLQERPARHLNTWKVCHITLYVLIALVGLANYIFLYKSMEMFDDNCVLEPRKLEFRSIELPEAQDVQEFNENHESETDIAQTEVLNDNVNDVSEKVKRETDDNEKLINFNEIPRFNVTEVIDNKTGFVLDTSRTLFATEGCSFAEYMPLLSTVAAAVWITLFTMCPSGGRSRSGLTEPWRILAPALLFSLMMMGFAGHNTNLVNSGIQDLCRQFYNYTNATTCSSIEPFVERSWNASWGVGGRLTATRAASAAVWAAWACAMSVLLARCLVAPDFVVHRTSVYLSSDPQRKIIDNLKKALRPDQPVKSSPKPDNVSMRSEPTITTELVTASLEQGDSAPTSLMVSPLKMSTAPKSEIIEMTYTKER